MREDIIITLPTLPTRLDLTHIGSADMRVDGSGVPVTFNVKVPAGVRILDVGIHCVMDLPLGGPLDQPPFDGFTDLPGLRTGILFGFERSDGFGPALQATVIQNNSDMARANVRNGITWSASIFGPVPKGAQLNLALTHVRYEYWVSLFESLYLPASAQISNGQYPLTFLAVVRDNLTPAVFPALSSLTAQAYVI